MVNCNKVGFQPKKGELIGNIIANAFFLWILSLVPGWELSWLKDNYTVVLFILQINCVVQIVGNAVQFLIFSKAFRLLIKAFLEMSGLVPLILLYYIFPFDFEGGLNVLDKLLPIFFIIGIVISVIQIIKYIIKFLNNLGPTAETDSVR